MELEKEKLESAIEQTQRDLSRKLNAIEEEARAKLEQLTLHHQMKKRPGVLLAASVGAGLLVGRSLVRPRTRVVSAPRQAPPQSLLRRASSAVTPLVLGVGVNALATLARRRYPKSADAINMIEAALITRL